MLALHGVGFWQSLPLLPLTQAPHAEQRSRLKTSDKLGPVEMASGEAQLLRLRESRGGSLGGMRPRTSPPDGGRAPAQRRAAQRPLTSAEPDSLLLKAVAAFVQESLLEAGTGRAAKGGRQSQDSRGGRAGWKDGPGAADANPSALTACPAGDTLVDASATQEVPGSFTDLPAPPDRRQHLHCSLPPQSDALVNTPATSNSRWNIGSLSSLW